jgi:glycosyltransferase involved in cell wall biosynthesis
MYNLLGEHFCFVETQSLSKERAKMGWYIIGETPYKKFFNDNPNSCKKLITESDLVISGSAPEGLIRPRIDMGKVLFRYSERPLKGGLEPLKYLPRLLKWHYQNPFYKKIYMLCASGYTAGDYAKFGLFKNRTFKWGYFPETKVYDLEKLFSKKSNNKKVSILWVGRFLGWKHPDVSILIAEELIKAGYDFELKIIGTGEKESMLKKLVADKNLSKYVKFFNPMPIDQIRLHMEQSDIFLFTSDFHEGWGAVLNEAMNSGCAVVASHAIGSVPFLLKNNINGLVYENGNIDMLYKNVIRLIEQPIFRRNIGQAAYNTIITLWNAEIASKRLITLFEAIQQGKESPFVDGPCSSAIPISEKYIYKN